MNKLPVHQGFRKGSAVIGWILFSPEDYEVYKTHRISLYGRYPSVLIKRKRYGLHRLIMKAKEGEVVDHANHDLYDCRKENLRICGQSQNVANQRLRPNKKDTPYKGVRKKSKNSWAATVRKQGTTYSLGQFKTDVEAAKAYDAKAKELFGEFACLNFPEETHEEE